MLLSEREIRMSSKTQFAKKKIIFSLLGLLIITLIYLFSPSLKNTVEVVTENIDKTLNSYKENEILKKDLVHLDSINSEIEDYKNENINLKETIEMNNYINDKLKYHTQVETVLNRDYDKWFNELVITSDNSYRKGVVMTSKGLIGKILDNDENNIHTVNLITGELNNVAGTVQDNEEIQGIIGEYDRDKGFLLMKYISNNDPKKIIGKNIITSGKGGIYPYGLIVGKVKEISTSGFGLNKVLLIEPSANFSEINNVIVITD